VFHNKKLLFFQLEVVGRLHGRQVSPDILFCVLQVVVLEQIIPQLRVVIAMVLK
jgi:hypothetical protein